MPRFSGQTQQSKDREPFFGIGPADKEKLILEPMFFLTYYGGFTPSETWNFPVAYKRWFIERISKELGRGAEQGQNTSRALHQNTPEIRSLQGNLRETSPSRLRRFS